MSKQPSPTIVELNLLPVEQRPTEVASAALAFGAAVIIAISALVPLSVQAAQARSDAQSMKDRAAVAEAGLHDVQVDIARQRAVSDQLVQAKREVADVLAVRAKMQGGTRALQDDLIWLYGLGFLTNGMKVTAVTGTVDGFKVDGVAPGPLDAIAYADKLATNGGFPSARVAAFAPGAKSGGQFTVEVKR